MNYQEFKAKYLGQSLDWDKSFGNQCVDLYRYYCDALGIPQSPPVAGAKDIWNSYLPQYFDRIPNTVTGIPPQGAVIIWDGRVGNGNGHVAIADTANLLTFISLDINWPVEGYYNQSGVFIGTGKVHLQPHNDFYRGVLGWLIPKKAASPILISEKACLEEINQKVRNSATNCVDKGELMTILAKVGL